MSGCGCISVKLYFTNTICGPDLASWLKFPLPCIKGKSEVKIDNLLSFVHFIYVVDHNILVTLGNIESIYLKEIQESSEGEEIENSDGMAQMN